MKIHFQLLLRTAAAVAGVCVLFGARDVKSQPVAFTTLHRFSASDGITPFFGLTMAANGTFYGTCYGSGGAGGSVFQLNSDGTVAGTVFTVLHTFNEDGAESATNVGGANPLDGPLIGTDGLLYGCTAQGGSGGYGVVYSLTPDGASYNAFQQFSFTGTGVEYLSSGIVQGSDGFLYGAGDSNATNTWDAQIYKIDTNGNNYANLAYFTYSSGGFDGNPLIAGRNGNLYGVTGGDDSDGDAANLGTVFMLTTGGTYTDLHDFAGNDGVSAGGGLIEDTHGTLYGTALSGGSYNNGTAFSVGTNGQNFTVIHSFGNGTDGDFPLGRLLLAADGYLYGTTLQGGTNDEGMVFRMATNGANYQVLYNFTGDVSSNGDQGYPNGCLTEAGSRLIYGMVGDLDFDYDPPAGNGTIFVLNAPPSGGPPAITNVTSSAGNLVLSGNSGMAYGIYTIMASGDLLRPLAGWVPVETNSFDGSGNFIYTNSTGIASQQFFIIEE